MVTSSIAFHNRKAMAPSLEVDVLVSAPDLEPQELATSALAFLNVLDSLESLISRKVRRAKSEHIAAMDAKSKSLQKLKSLLRGLQAFGAAAVEEIGPIEDFEFAPSGDIDADIDTVLSVIMQRQQALYELDESYRPLHAEIKRLQTAKQELAQFSDTYKMRLSQLKRVRQRLSSCIEENRMNTESAQEAVRATQEQQAWMIAKISNKMVATQQKLEQLQSGDGQQNEVRTCANFLNGLREFLAGLKKLRKASDEKIVHLSTICEQLKAQHSDVETQIGTLREEAMNKLATVRETCLRIESEQQQQQKEQTRVKSEPKKEQKYEDDEDEDISDLSEDGGDDEESISDFSADDADFAGAHSQPLSMLELMHKREKFMSRVYKSMHELERRAATTSSADYLRGLTEIRELEMILGRSELKYFFTKFVDKCNRVFNDCCLASQAILENTAEMGSEMLTKLDGVQMLQRVLRSNRRKFDDDSAHQRQLHLDCVVNFVQSLPDREVVIMQIARHLALSLPFRELILREREGRSEERGRGSHLVRIDEFIADKIREWMGSILSIYGAGQFSSVHAALENDVVAQVRPSHAAALIVNCVYGIDVSL